MRFPEFADEWKQTTLGEIASFFSGGTPSTIQKEFYEGDIPFIRSGEIHSKNTEIKISESALANSSAKLVEIEDILLALYGATSGDIAISQIRGAINQAILCIRPYCDFNKHYVFYHWQRNYNSVVKKYLQGGQGNLSAEIVKSVLFRYPSASEQKKIASFLSLIDERIQSCSETIKERKREKAALLNQLFSQKLRFPQFSDEWQQTTLGEVLDYEQPTNYIVRNTEYSSNVSLIPVLTANKSFILGYTYEQDAYNKGKCIILDDFTLDIKFVNFPFKVKSSAIKILVAKDGTNILFIYNCLLFLRLSEQEKDHKRHYISEIQPLIVALPSLSEQNKIADFLSLIDERIEVEEELLKQYEMQKKYLLRQMFI